METQIEKPYEEDVEVAWCMDIGYIDFKTLTKNEELNTVLHHLQRSLKAVHGNVVQVCKGRNGIIIRGWYFVTEQMSLCTNICLHIVKSNSENIDNPLDYCEKTCEKFIAPRARATLIENYNKLVYTLARHGFEFNARLGDSIFQIEIKQ